MLPTKERGAWRGSLFVNAADQSALGEVEVVIEHEPLSLRRARQRVTWAGALERSYAFERVRDGARTQYEGPEVFGNATSLRPGALHQPAPGRTRTRAASRRSRAARC